MPTLSDLIERTRLAAKDHPARDSLNAQLNLAATSATLATGTEVPKGAFLDIELEIVRVTAKPATTTATIVRGQYGSADAQHANGTEVLINPRYHRFQIRHAINETLRSISAAFGKKTWNEAESFSTSARLIQVPAAAIRVFEVAEKPTSDTSLTSIPFRFRASVPTSLIGSGKAVELVGHNPGSGTVYIAYEENWPTLSALADSLDSTFPSEAEDLITLGAMAFLESSDLFTRLAFTAPHLRAENFLSNASEIRLAQNSTLAQYLTRRSELAARIRPVNLDWIKG